jgi:hypothetical protein
MASLWQLTLQALVNLLTGRLEKHPDDFTAEERASAERIKQALEQEQQQQK